MKFTDFGFTDGLNDSLDAMRFETPTPIQEQAIPEILAGRDLIAVAQTGTGKTAAYLLPVMDMIERNQNNALHTLVVSPTRELAKQIDQALEGFAYFTSVSSKAVYGGGDGTSFESERSALKGGTNIIVATPGRLLSHLRLGYIDTSSLKCLILDEADRMLDMGFYEDIMQIIRKLPEERQTLMFSATMPPRIRTMTANVMKDPAEVNIAISKPAAGIAQRAYMAHNDQKIRLVEHLVSSLDEDSNVIIFSSTKRNVKDINRTLQRRKLPADAIHSDLEQEQREQVLLAFKNKRTRILVATDIVARGIDIEGLSMVINFDVPQDAEDYVHRIGRTARADATGIGITFINSDDVNKFHRIETLIETEVEKPPLPGDLGEGPEYRPRKDGGGGRGGNNRHRGGGGKGRGGNRKGGGGNRSGGKGGNRGGGQGGNRKRGGGGGNRNRGRSGGGGQGGGGGQRGGGGSSS